MPHQHTLADAGITLVENAAEESFDKVKVLVSSLFSSPASLASGAVAALATGAICLYASGEILFVYWLIAALAINLYRLAFTRFFNTAVGDITTIAMLRYYERHFVVGAMLQSLLMGTAAVIAILMTHSDAAQIASVTSAIAFSSGFVARNAARPRFVAAQLLVTVGPLTVAFFMSSMPDYNLIGLFAILFIVSNVVQTRSVHRNLVALSVATAREKELTQAVREKNRMLDIALAHMSQGLALFDEAGRLTVSNQRFLDFLSVSDAGNTHALPANQLASLLVVRGVLDRVSARALHKAWTDMQQNGGRPRFDLSLKSGHILDVILTPVEGGGFLMTSEDVTAARKAQARIEHLARFDDLTGLLNRHEANVRLSQWCDRPNSFAVAYLDICQFKEINGRFGHEAGDLTLQAVGRRLQSFVRDDGFVGRLGGDEFIVVLDVTDSAHAMRLLSRLSQSLERPIMIEGRSLKAPVKIGFSMFPDHGTTALQLQRAADLALYRAKEKSIGPMAYLTEMGQAAARLRDMEEDLRKALVKGGLELYYQPIIDLNTKTIVSFEALMRWKHPERGFIPPSEFIPVAESTNLIVELGEWAIHEAARSIATWPRHVSVAVNVSPIQFASGERLLEVVRSALAESGIPASQLTLEVTESVLIDDSGSVRDTMIKLRDMGVKCALDDFGTGYSSLSYLASFPFYCVKIDRCFVKDIEASRASRATVEAVCHLARSLGIQTVAEGIEEAAQGDVLAQIGVNRGQGYHYGRPAPWSEASARLSQAA
ncbi:MAG TPA: EAL domain-containing protein [Beijerinckiaceae bacterium]|nr:EAL domain-containing protein [Beijerinckiaceae bacterium]